MLAERRRVLRSGGPILGCRARDASGTFMAWLLIVLFLFSDKGEKEDGFMACHVRKSMANRWRRNHDSSSWLLRQNMHNKPAANVQSRHARSQVFALILRRQLFEHPPRWLP